MEELERCGWKDKKELVPYRFSYVKLRNWTLICKQHG